MLAIWLTTRVCHLSHPLWPTFFSMATLWDHRFSQKGSFLRVLNQPIEMAPYLKIAM